MPSIAKGDKSMEGSSITPEQIAHDLALSYGLYFSLKNDDSIVNPDGYLANYKRDYKEFLKLLTE